jgi:hypothetical protein
MAVADKVHRVAAGENIVALGRQQRVDKRPRVARAEVVVEHGAAVTGDGDAVAGFLETLDAREGYCHAS